MHPTNDIETQLKESENRYYYLLDNSIHPVIIYNQQYKILYANSSATNMLTIVNRNEIIGKSIFDFVHPDYKDITYARIRETFEKEKLDFTEYKLNTSDGKVVDFMFRSVKTEYNNEKAVMILGCNVTSNRELVNKLAENEERFKSMFNNNPDAVFVIDLEGKFTILNAACENISGYSKEELLSMRFDEIVDKDDVESVFQYHQKAKTNVPQTYECRIRHKNGSSIDLSVKSFPMIINGVTTGVYGIAKDITAQKKAECQINRMAYYDTLTGLPNRNYFNEYLTKVLHSYKNNTNAILFIDLDRFKAINDTMGHSFGDIVLKEVAKKLADCVDNNGFVSRYGGDEFLVLLKDIEPSFVQEVSQRIINEFSSPFIINGEEVYVTASIGISFYPKDGNDEDTLLKSADIAMYLAKESGRNNFQYYTNFLNESFNERVQMEKDLRKALENDEMMLYYQPQIDLLTGKIVCMEALIRWNHPKDGIVSPARFIPLAEETGLIISVGKWVIETACKQCKAWQDMGLGSVGVSVNISAKQFQDKDFINIVTNALNDAELEPKFLEIEITESSMNNLDELSVILKVLKSKGVRVAIDDFGSGYSSLSVIKNLHIDKLKVDKSFVDDILVHDKTTALIKTIIEMGYNLEFTITAEGIEQEKQLQFLKENLCQFGQGYLFSRPLPLEEIVKLGVKINNQ